MQGNVCCAGDPAVWREDETGWVKIDGTIHTIVLINQPLTAAALARAVVSDATAGEERDFRSTQFRSANLTPGMRPRRCMLKARKCASVQLNERVTVLGEFEPILGGGRDHRRLDAYQARRDGPGGCSVRVERDMPADFVTASTVGTGCTVTSYSGADTTGVDAAQKARQMSVDSLALCGCCRLPTRRRI